jgi:chaperone BCS1
VSSTRELTPRPNTAPQVSSGAFIGTAALASIAVFHVLHALLRAATDALFVTYVFPRDCGVRARPCAAAVACWQRSARARPDTRPRAPPRAPRMRAPQSYDRVSRWLASRPEVAASSAVLQFYDARDDAADSEEEEEEVDAAAGANAGAAAGAAAVAQVLLRGNGANSKATLLRTRPLPGASVVLRLAGARVWVSRHAPPKKRQQQRLAPRRRLNTGGRAPRHRGYEEEDDSEEDSGDADNVAVHLTLLRAHGPRVLSALLAGAQPPGAAAAAAAQPKPGRRPPPLSHYTAVASSDGDGWKWESSRARLVSLPELVGLDDAAETLRADMARFLASERWYAARGIPYRRGYLLHGPAGCGKTALALALAAELELRVQSVELSHPDMTDDGLASLFRSRTYGAARKVMLLRRVDRMFDERGQPRPGAPKGLSFSALLNVCDGVNASRDGAMVIFTSERDHTQLDAALARPGRMDKRCAIPAPSAASGAAFFRRFYAGHPLHDMPPPALGELADAFEHALQRRLAADEAARGGGGSSASASVSMRSVVSFLTTRAPRRAIDDIEELGLDALQVAARATASGGASGASSGAQAGAASGSSDAAAVVGAPLPR